MARMITPFAFTRATIVTGDPAGSIHHDWTVAVDATGTIAAVGPGAEVELPESLPRIDLAGRFVLPGLINAHAHLFADGTLLPPLYTRPATVQLVARVLRSFAGRALLRHRTRTNLTTQLHSGVTTLRSVGDVAYEVVEARAEIEAGRLAGRGSWRPGR